MVIFHLATNVKIKLNVWKGAHQTLFIDRISIDASHLFQPFRSLCAKCKQNLFTKITHETRIFGFLLANSSQEGKKQLTGNTLYSLHFPPRPSRKSLKCKFFLFPSRKMHATLIWSFSVPIWNIFGFMRLLIFTIAIFVTFAPHFSLTFLKTLFQDHRAYLFCSFYWICRKMSTILSLSALFPLCIFIANKW